MIDIEFNQGEDVGTYNSQTYRAANILSIQQGSLEYEPDLGIDLDYFLSEEFSFQNDSFKSYLVQILANYSINVSSVVDVVHNVYMQYTFNLSPPEAGDQMIAR